MAVSPSVESLRVAGIFLEDIFTSSGELISRPDVNVKIRLVRNLIDTALAVESETFIEENTAERLRLIPDMPAVEARRLAQVVLAEKFRLMRTNPRRPKAGD